jgi:hypothetical protein
MAMGHIAAANIHQQLLHRETGKAPEWIEFPVVSPMIALAVGKQAVMYGEEDGTTWGEENMKMMFGNDLGFTSKSWSLLRNKRTWKLTYMTQFVGTIWVLGKNRIIRRVE